MIAELLIVAITALPVRFSPATPTIGDLVHVEVRHSAPITFERSETIELVRSEGNKASVRVLRTGPQKVSFTVNDAARTSRLAFNIVVASVLAPDDALQPAPLAAPQKTPYPRAAIIACSVAALAALFAWTLLAYLHRRVRRQEVPAGITNELSPRAELEAALETLRERRDRDAAIALADAVRRYLARVDPALDLDLTTSELLARIPPTLPMMSKILRAGDRAKFAPWPSDADPRLVDAARQLLETYERVEEAS